MSMPGESQQVPVNAPDPTVVTTENIDKAVKQLEEKVVAWLEGRDNVLAERDLRYTERFNGQEKAVESAFESSETAIAKAEGQIEKRSDATYVSVQELARSLSELMPRAEAFALINAMGEKVAAAEKKADRLESIRDGNTEQRTDSRTANTAMITAATLFLSVVVFVANFLAR